MSYCRFSCMLGECDVYVYLSDVGYITHVASSRLKHPVPDEIKAMPHSNGDEWIAQDAALKRWRESLPCDEVPCRKTDGKKTWDSTIKTPKKSEYLDLSEISDFAGEAFRDDDPENCADRLERIRASGLNVPQYAIDTLREEREPIHD